MNFPEFAELWEEKEKPSWPLMEIVAEHTGTEGAEAAWWASRLHTHGVMNGFRVYSRSKDMTALQTLDLAIRDVQRILRDGSMTSLAHERLLLETMQGHHSQTIASRDIYDHSTDDEAKEIHAYMKENGKRDSTLLFDLEDRGDAIRAAIKRTIAAIETSPLTKVSASRINERGIALVDAARYIWQLATETDAPAKDLNPASPFGEFLADVFGVCEVEGDPRSAFRAWVRECERGHRSLDHR